MPDSLKNERDHFEKLWLSRKHSQSDHTAAAWNERALEWRRNYKDETNSHRPRAEQRVGETTKYLLDKGILTPETDIIDIGCGPGYFVNSFAHYARSAAGVDLSEEMVNSGYALAEAEGLTNVTYEVCDFRKADIKERGWEKAFDVVFTSITPAVCDPGDIDRIESMSRHWCLCCNFVDACDPLADQAIRKVLPGRTWWGYRDSRSFYAMFNILWLMGRFPEVRYFREFSEDLIPVGDALINRTLRTQPREIRTDEVREAIADFYRTKADADGLVHFPSERLYGWLLWNVNDRGERDYWTEHM